jgi:hypothetical protein
MTGPPIKLIVMEYWKIAEHNLEAFLAWDENYVFRAVAVPATSETRALWSDVTDPLGAEPLHP